jgi:hypothetical protein
LLKLSALEGIEAMEYAEQEPDRAGQRRISNTKWVYIKNPEAGRIAFGHDGINVPLDDDARKALLEKGERAPVYIKKLDSLFFGDSLIVSPYGMIKLPEGIELFIPKDNIPEEIKGAIFIASHDRKKNFMSIRDRGNGEFQWGYLFSEWAPSAGTEPTDAGVRLFLSKRGKPIAEVLLPELARNDKIESKDEFFTDPRDGKKYRIVKIASQTWLADNLNYEGKGKKKVGFAYDDKSSNADKYGRLYTWKEALTDFAGGADTAAEALKSEDWDGTNAFGFSALPGGYRNRDGDFDRVGGHGGWWSATEEGSENAYGWDMFSGDARVYRFDYYEADAEGVRLVRD